MNKTVVIRIIVKALSLISIMLFLNSCGTTKGYVGKNVDQESLSRVVTVKNQVKINNRNGVETLWLVSIDDKVVGNYMKGYPGHCDILPGKHVIGVQHYRSWEDKATTNAALGGALFGAIGGAVAAASANAANPKPAYEICFYAEAGVIYNLTVRSDIETGTPSFFVIDTVSGKEVEFEITKK